MLNSIELIRARSLNLGKLLRFQIWSGLRRRTKKINRKSSSSVVNQCKIFHFAEKIDIWNYSDTICWLRNYKQKLRYFFKQCKPRKDRIKTGISRIELCLLFIPMHTLYSSHIFDVFEIGSVFELNQCIVMFRKYSH